jgi:hypothetical protein
LYLTEGPNKSDLLRQIEEMDNIAEAIAAGANKGAEEEKRIGVLEASYRVIMDKQAADQNESSKNKRKREQGETGGIAEASPSSLLADFARS